MKEREVGALLQYHFGDLFEVVSEEWLSSSEVNPTQCGYGAKDLPNFGDCKFASGFPLPDVAVFAAGLAGVGDGKGELEGLVQSTSVRA